MGGVPRRSRPAAKRATTNEEGALLHDAQLHLTDEWWMVAQISYSL
jgi:hypothetical protein